MALLTSPRVAAWLLAAMGAVAVVGTLTPQGREGDPRVVAWDQLNPQLAPLVSALDLHAVFTSPVFLALVLMLTASTTACAWRRTRAARARYRVLRALRRGDVPDAVKPATFMLFAHDDNAERVQRRVFEGLQHHGLRMRRVGDSLILSSHPLTVLASAVFHWALVGFFVTVAVSALIRSDGLMGVGQGELVPNVAESYGVLSQGPLHSFASPPLQIAVEGFELDFRTGSIDVGPTPSVALYDAGGGLIARQRVYPNNPLQVGPLTIHSNDYGLSPRVALVGPDGRELGQSTLLVDFSDETTSGTLPSKFALTDAEGRPSIEVELVLQADRDDGAVVRSIPDDPRARVTLTSLADGRRVAEGELTEGSALTLPDGASVRLLGVGYYARLNVVDDWTIPALYAVLSLIVVAVSVALLARQRLLVVESGASGTGTAVSVTVRAWRFAGFTVDEIKRHIESTLDRFPEGGPDV